MSLSVRGMGQCGSQEICNLRDYPSAEEAMKEFCRLTFGEDSAPFRGYVHTKDTPAGASIMSPLYVFTAAIYENWEQEIERQRIAWEQSWAKYPVDQRAPLRTRTWEPYGHQFAQLIETDKLGVTTTIQPGRNWRNHPDHCNQMWVWCPDPGALWEWWDARKPKNVEAPKLDLSRYGFNSETVSFDFIGGVIYRKSKGAELEVESTPPPPTTPLITFQLQVGA